MSLVLDVIPRRPHIPTLGELSDQFLALAAGAFTMPAVAELMRADEVTASSVQIEIVDESPAPLITRTADRTLSLRFGEHQYGWFSTDGRATGFDFYFSAASEREARECRADMADDVGALSSMGREDVLRGLGVTWWWSLRLQAAQPVGTRMVAGLAACALAGLVDGYISSIDGAADPWGLPAEPASF